ncbi:MAG: hypothetical protein L6V91_07505 [Bacilli bacterium]|nr:MAG: hypothetical protein L6V91_07505 [Bacilli bacterium]
MKEILNIMLEYIISYALGFFLLYYLLFLLERKTKYNKNKVPVEYYYVISLYGLKEKKILIIKKFMYMTLFVNTFIIVTTYIIVFKLLDNWIWMVICGIVIIILLIVICYGIIGRYYQKKQKIERRK